MANYVTVTFKNATIDQHVFQATDNVMDTQVANVPLASGESTEAIRLVAADDGYGHCTYGFKGEMPTIATDLTGGAIDVF